MAYQLAIDTPGVMQHPSFEYQSLQDALEAVEKALAQGYLEIAGELTVFTGPGTIYKVVSDEHIRSGMRQAEKPFYMVVQVAGGQIPPFGFDSEKEMTEALDKAIAGGGGNGGVLRHVAKADHEYNFISLTTGVVAMRMTRHALQENQKRLVEAKMRQRKETREMSGLPPTILIPGKN